MSDTHLRHAPRFDEAGAQALAHRVFGIAAAARALPSERDQNFLLESDGRERFVLKIANRLDDAALLEAQNAAMSHAAAHGALVPVVVPALDGAILTTADAPDGSTHLVRVLTWIPGVPLGTVPRHSASLLADLGRRLGELDRALQTFDHPAIHRDFHWDLSHGAGVVRTHLNLVADPELRETVAGLVDRANLTLAPLTASLPRAAVHNDINDYNVLVVRQALDAQVSAFIDFGDMLHGYAVADLAVAIAYAMLDKADPLAAARAIVAGYHSTRPLSEGEVAALFSLSLLRIGMSVAIAASQTQQRPGDDYLAITQAPIVRSLPLLASIPPGFAEAVFRHACGFERVPGAARINAWLEAAPAAPVLGGAEARGAVLDLSVASPLVSGAPEQNSERHLTPRIAAFLTEAGAAVGIGRYGEPRLLYSTPLFAQPDACGERRTIHLGVDLFAAPGTPVHAPLPGTVAHVGVNDAPLDYGPVVVLRHETDDGTPFFTLYGHLALEPAGRLSVDDTVAKGEAFAAIGAADVNGGWTPHVHLQLILDLLDLGLSFPGVCRAGEREVWQALSPDPCRLLRIPGAAYPAAALDAPGALAHRQEVTGGNLSVAYVRPVQIDRGWMQYLYDRTGRRYLDAYNNVPHVGHSHPAVVRAVSGQLRVLNTNTRYLNDSLALFARRLTATLPAPLSVCYLVSSGSEANELALRIARAHTKARNLIVLDAAYHGNTTTLIDISPYKFNGPGGEGAPAWVHVAPLPDVYRGAYRGPDAGALHAADVAALIERIEGPLCGFIAETCPSVGGQIMLPPGYLERVYRDVRARGGVCIADEVQTAYGRLGSAFYAFENHAVVPDIVVLGKPIGNGYPLGAVVTTASIAASFDNGMEYFSTFGGSTAACAAGLAVLDTLEHEHLQQHARQVGVSLSEGLRGLGRHALVGHVRGDGLFWGVELVRDRATLEAAPGEAAYVVNRLREEGILVGTDGPLHNVIKIRPPMPFDGNDASRLVETLDRVLGEMAW